MNYIKYKNSIKKLSADEIDSLGDDWTSCWLYSYVFAKQNNFPINSETFEPILENTRNKQDFKFCENGNYLFYIENQYEMHYFIVTKFNENCICTCTYGGFNKFICASFTSSQLENYLQNLTVDVFETIFMPVKVNYPKDTQFNSNISFTFRNA